MLDQAINHFQAGNLSQADHLLQKILARQPDHIQALQLSGRLDASRNRLNDAAKTFKKAISLDVNNPTLHYDLGIVQKKLGNVSDAIICYRQAIALAPNFAEAYFNLGNALAESRKFANAAQNFKQALQIRPNYKLALANLSIALTQLNRLPELAVVCEQLIQCTPEFSEAHYLLGIIHQKQGKLNQALNNYQQALNANPNLVNAHHNIGTIYNIQGKLPTAIEHYQNALQIKPDHIISLINLCDSYESLNKLDEAENTARRVLELDSGNPLANRVIATLLRREKKVDEAYTLLSKVEIPQDPGMAQSIHFELGKLCDAIGNYEQAYQHFFSGNQLLATAQNASTRDKSNYLQLIKVLKTTFTADWLKTWHKPRTTHTQPNQPVFLIGFPRSGTTLLDQILDSHPQIQVMEEQPVLADIRNRIDTMASGYPEALAELSDDALSSLRKKYFLHAKEFTDLENETTLIDKLPLNIIHIGLCIRLFPEAKFILALRHPCDACLSCFMQPFSYNEAMANFYTLRDSAILYDKTMDLWQHYQALLPLNFHAIKYENLIDNIELEIKSLLTFLDIPWNDRVLDYNHHARNRAHINTPSYNQVTQPIYKTAKYRWQRYESPMQPVMPLLTPWIQYFGY